MVVDVFPVNILSFADEAVSAFTPSVALLKPEELNLCTEDCISSMFPIKYLSVWGSLNDAELTFLEPVQQTEAHFSFTAQKQRVQMGFAQKELACSGTLL